MLSISVIEILLNETNKAHCNNKLLDLNIFDPFEKFYKYFNFIKSLHFFNMLFQIIRRKKCGKLTYLIKDNALPHNENK